MGSQQTNKTQVVIVGAGPSGLSLAAQLLRYDIDFIIFDKKDRITDFSKALAVQARTLEIFRELGIARQAVQEGQTTTAFNIIYKGKPHGRVDISGLGQSISPFPFALSLEQSKTEKLLAGFLAEKGKNICWNYEYSHCEQGTDSVIAYFTRPDGQQRRVEASFLVGCDGAGSPVRNQLGLPFEGSTEAKLFYVADVRLKSPAIDREELFMYMIPKGFVLFFPMEGAGHYRIVGVVPGSEGTKSENRQISFDDIAPFIKKQIITPIEFVEINWFSTYKVHTRKAGAFSKGRCFIAGDAAHIHTPAGGQGMNTGIQDAYNLAWKMAFSIKGLANDTLLESYSTERTANAKHLLQTTDRMFDIMSGVNPFWNFVRLNLFPPFLHLVTNSEYIRKKAFPLISMTGISYPRSFLTVRSSIGKVRAGDRMHYFIFSDGRDIFSFLTDPAFKLLFFGDKSQGASRDLAAGQSGHSKIPLKYMTFTEIPTAIFGRAANFYILLRPDNHISYIGNEIEKCWELLASISR
jgi:2-polyprenyl-6-methoxyphenol hydroxylase-like FAD-dependent oxidoreductase